MAARKFNVLGPQQKKVLEFLKSGPKLVLDFYAIQLYDSQHVRNIMQTLKRRGLVDAIPARGKNNCHAKRWKLC